MKAIAILMVIALVVAVCGVGYLYMTANVSVVAVGMTATEATVQQATFDKLKTDLAQNSLIGTSFQNVQNWERRRHISFIPIRYACATSAC